MIALRAQADTRVKAACMLSARPRAVVQRDPGGRPGIQPGLLPQIEVSKGSEKARNAVLTSGRFQLWTVLLKIAEEKGSALSSDGWDSTDKRPIINFVQSAPSVMAFRGSVDTTGITKDGDYIADLLLDQIEAMGPDKVVQLILDNASNMISAAEKVMEKYSHITHTRCTPHCLDLCLEAIARLPWVQAIVDKARKAVLWIRNHQKSLAIYRTFAKKQHITPGALALSCALRAARGFCNFFQHMPPHPSPSFATLLTPYRPPLPGDTRFTTNFYMLERAVEVP